MGRESDAMMEYLKDNERFADVFNGGLFEGHKIVKAEELSEDSEVYKEKGKCKTSARIRDLKKRLHSGGRLKILAIENENQVDYAMPWRTMNYDSLEYGEQIRRIRKENIRDKKLKTSAEFTSGLLESDRLAPVFTVCLYHGQEKWNGPRCLKDMIDFGKDSDLWERLFSDYQMQIICLNEIKNFDHFESPLKELFMALACRQDKAKLRQLMETNSAYHKLDIDTAEVIGVMTGMEKEIAKRKKGDEVNMCEALRGLLEDSRAEGVTAGIIEGKAAGIIEGKAVGIIEGKAAGIKERNIQLVKHMKSRGYDCETIADLLEMSIETIRKM